MSLDEFAKWAQMILTGFSGLVLSMFWLHVRNLERKGRDLGFLYLGTGLLVWALLYALELTFPSQGSDGDPARFDRFLRRILSVTNSGLFLLTLPLFEHGFERLHQRLGFFHDPAKWRGTVLTGAALTLILTFVTYRLFDTPEQEWIAGLPDGIFSVIAILALGYAMMASFAKRRLPSLSVLTALVLLTLLSVQVLDFLRAAEVLVEGIEVDLLLRLASHTLLAMLFFALAFTWVVERLGKQQNIERAVSQAPPHPHSSRGEALDPEGRKISFSRTSTGKYYIELTWPEKGLSQHQVPLSEGKFKYFLLTAVRKIEGNYVHGDQDIKFLYGGNIDRSNSAIKESLNRSLPPEVQIQDRGELFESRGQGSRQYRLSFLPAEIDLPIKALAEEETLREVLGNLLD